MKSVNKLIVTYHDRYVGSLSMTPDNRLCAFQYDKSWLANGFSISPLDLPLKPNLFIAKPEPFWGNFDIFEDSLPDGYGRYLLNRMLKKQGINDSLLTPLQRLSIVGTSGMGALCYIPETYLGGEKTLPEWDELQQMALDILSEKSDKVHGWLNSATLTTLETWERWNIDIMKQHANVGLMYLTSN